MSMYIVLATVSWFLTLAREAWIHVLMVSIGRIHTFTGLTMLIAMISVMVAVLSLIVIKNPPAPPYSVTLLYRQVRIKLGLSRNLNEIVDCFNVTVLRHGTNKRLALYLPLK